MLRGGSTPASAQRSIATSSARAVSTTVPPGVAFAHSALVPGGLVRRPVTRMPCAVLELKYSRTLSGKATGSPVPSCTLSDPRSCQNSVSESVCMTSGSVAGRFITPSWIPEMGSVVTAYVMGA